MKRNRILVLDESVLVPSPDSFGETEGVDSVWCRPGVEPVCDFNPI